MRAMAITPGVAYRKIQSYKDLLVWQRGRELVDAIYQLTEGFPKTESYGLTILQWACQG